MKKLIILITAILFSYQISKAQTEKGSQTLGVNLILNYYNQSGVANNPYDNTLMKQGTKFTMFSAGPVYSYFIADNLDLGASLNYSLTDNKDAYNNLEQDNKSYGGTLFLRKYVLYKDKIGFRVGPYLGYTIGDQKFDYTGENSISNTDAKSHTYQGGANLDLLYYPTKHLGVSLSLAN